MDFYLFGEPPVEYDDKLDWDLDCDPGRDLVDSYYSPLHFLTPSASQFAPHYRAAISRKSPATTSVDRKMTATAAPVSPSSSPRLPSPPPFTEVQIGPQSPAVGDNGGDGQLFSPLTDTDDGSTRRIRPGTKAADMASGPPLVPLSQVS